LTLDSTEKQYGWEEIQSEVQILSERQLEDLFQASGIQSVLQREEDTLKQLLKTCEDQEYLLFGGDLLATKDLDLVF
jgi:hypothetical protein